MDLLSAAKDQLTTQEALSGVFGSISLVSWIVVLVPQLFQNYRTQSAEAISIPFLCIWFVGDVCNLIGAIWAQLVPTVIALAIYFCIADAVLILQCLYYNYKNRKQPGKDESASAVVDGNEDEDDEEQPLLTRTRSGASDSNVGLPGSQRRKSSAASRGRADSENVTPMAKIDEEDEDDESSTRAIMKNLGSILVICAIGTAAWAICWKASIWKPVPAPQDGDVTEGQHDTPLGAEILGYASAVFYLGARIPQIVKNRREKSCEGLSLLFFLLSMLGNLTYGAGILFHSLDRQYLLTNLPWLIGSLGTMGEDITIYLQFYMYKS